MEHVDYCLDVTLVVRWYLAVILHFFICNLYGLFYLRVLCHIECMMRNNDVKEAITAYFQVQLPAGSEENRGETRRRWSVSDQVLNLTNLFQLHWLYSFEWRNDMNDELGSGRK